MKFQGRHWLEDFAWRVERVTQKLRLSSCLFPLCISLLCGEKVTHGKSTAPKGIYWAVNFPRKMTEKRQTSQGSIIRILQHFATKLWNITNFVMLFQAVMKFLSRLVEIKI
jgi:hypothetical protein